MAWGRIDKPTVDRAVTIMREFLDDEECDYDHHGYCQMHNYFGDPPCRMVRLRGFLREMDS